MPDNDFTEDALVEQPAIALFKQLNWEEDEVMKVYGV